MPETTMTLKCRVQSSDSWGERAVCGATAGNVARARAGTKVGGVATKARRKCELEVERRPELEQSVEEADTEVGTTPQGCEG